MFLLIVLFSKGLSVIWIELHGPPSMPRRARASVLDSGPVPGPLQAIGRAELYGLISAIPSKSSFGPTQLARVERHRSCRPATSVTMLHGDNHDLWLQLADALSGSGAEQVEFRWLPSHVDTALCESPPEEFLATWNDIVDQHAAQANRNRSSVFESLCSRAEEYYALWTTRLHQLRHF